MKKTVRMAALVALVCSPVLAFAKVQGTGLAIADVTLAHEKAEHMQRVENAAHRVASHRVDRPDVEPHRS
ncbi:hypothetical protein WT01_20850 [Burkholderia cepacia]|uniref:DUF4148 domain-containing protein n=1 Tax=Burkholderia cepacia TaxID=292 RepID=A0A103UGI6_BURCE|nr:hypothetical protein [Burkholderia cepacia]KVH35055.1 hypothetical protein WS88_18525 [Burkholderia cepacia]KVK89144.1 hypothetical protein WS90_36605 [Burkholderia cepacia]KVK95874.1 hypothetical protein WS93_25390 [Burkholderia cepacia]KVL56170.1 hypothetical protein WT01_20850 [Burkholderia cepacia]